MPGNSPESSVQQPLSFEAITALTATEMADKIRKGELTSRRVIDAHIACIEAVNPALNAVILPVFEQARQQAEAADAAQLRGEWMGPLHGVPVTIKDQFHIKGLPTSFGMSRLKHNTAAENGDMVSALINAGAIILGKTNIPQTLAVIETDNALFGRCNNPWDLDRSPGGSSGGEAAIISAGGSPLGLGADFGGSLRVPAAWCGIYSLKPTARRLTLDAPPVTTASGTEGIAAQPGPMARSTADLNLAFRIMVEHTCQHPNGIVPPVPFADPDRIDISTLRIALLPQIGDWQVCPAGRRALDEAAAALRSRGATVEEWTDAPDTQAGVMLFFRIVGADGLGFMKQLLQKEQPVPLLKPSAQLTSIPNTAIPLVASLMHAKGERRMANTLRNTRRQSADGLLNLLGERIAYETQFTAAMDKGNYDAILCPLLPVPAVRHGDTGALADFWGSMLLFNVLGMPAGAVPVTRVRTGEESDRPDSKDKAEQTAKEVEQGSAGLPMGVQIVARHWREDMVLAVMGALEKEVRKNTEYPKLPVIL
jgi:fatty acid amide hydrolase